VSNTNDRPGFMTAALFAVNHLNCGQRLGTVSTLQRKIG
jgi:hypothetical protein